MQHKTTGNENNKLEKNLLSDPGKIGLWSLSIQPMTWTKSETKLGILHLIKTSLPLMTYSSSALVEYAWLTTKKQIVS